MREKVWERERIAYTHTLSLFLSLFLTQLFQRDVFSFSFEFRFRNEDSEIFSLNHFARLTNWNRICLSTVGLIAGLPNGFKQLELTPFTVHRSPSLCHQRVCFAIRQNERFGGKSFYENKNRGRLWSKCLNNQLLLLTAVKCGQSLRQQQQHRQQRRRRRQRARNI